MSISFCTIVRLDIGALTALHQHSFLLFIRFLICPRHLSLVARIAAPSGVFPTGILQSAARCAVQPASTVSMPPVTCLKSRRNVSLIFLRRPFSPLKAKNLRRRPLPNRLQPKWKPSPAVQEKSTEPAPAEISSVNLVSEQSQEKPAATVSSDKPAKAPEATALAAAPASTPAPQIEPSATAAESQTMAEPRKTKRRPKTISFCGYTA